MVRSLHVPTTGKSVPKLRIQTDRLISFEGDGSVQSVSFVDTRGIKNRSTIGILIFFLLALGCRTKAPDEGQTARGTGSLNGKVGLAELQADDGQWVMPARNYAST